MKYLKTYELAGKNEIQEFNEGDWVYFYNNIVSDYFYGQIEDVYYIRDKVIGDRCYYQIKDVDDYYHNIQQHFIYRKMTPAEIEHYKIKRATNKYNL